MVEIRIPDGAEELCESCFCKWESLLRVPFGASSSLKLIGARAFNEGSVRETMFPMVLSGS